MHATGAPRAPDDDTLFLDLEVAVDGSLAAIGAVLGDAAFERRVGGGTTAAQALADLGRFAAPARRVAGHNLIGFDLPRLAAVVPSGGAGSRVLALPAVDTLVLSPLAFPAKPYHALVKDYKLLHDARNDPVADARLARTLLSDETARFDETVRDDPELAALLRSPLEGWTAPDTGRPSAAGTAAWLAERGAPRFDDAETVARAAARFRAASCPEGLADAVRATLADPASRPAAAFAFAWLQVAETRSVLPRWVRRRFPAVGEIVRRARDVPCGAADCSWCARVHDPRRQLAEIFRYDGFRGPPTGAAARPAQEAVVRLGMRGRPHLAILPTSFGKSICYQLPALVRHARTGALTIVVSPLQALMKDQVDGLRDRVGSEAAATVNGLLTPPERAEALARVRDGDVALLYVSPEQLRNRSFRETIRARELAAWVFDEAHCLAKWGHDFRTDYHYAGRFLRELSEGEGTPVAPVACFTATARQDVREEILAYFREHVGQELEVVEIPPERANLRFAVRQVPEESKFTALDDELRERLAVTPGKAIVYLSTRRRTEQAAEFLAARGWAARAFHAGMEAPEKRAAQEAFKRGDVRVVCATNAFGMGIDEPDVRAVLHADVPGSLENYLQEAGRAGRDGNAAHCVLLFHEKDLERQFDLLARSRLTRIDVAQILSAVRRCRSKRGGEAVVVTAGELLRDDRTDVSFDAGDRDARTKVATAVSWLERGGFLLRDENHTNVFQGRPLVRSLDEARARIASLGLPPRRREQWESILRTLLNADERAMLDMDELAAAAGFRSGAEEAPDEADRRLRPATQAVLRLRRTLLDMARNGLIDEGLSLTAFVRTGIADDSASRLRTLDEVETAFVALLRESAPDLAPADTTLPPEEADEDPSWAALDLRLLNAAMDAAGHRTAPETLRRLLFALAQDGRRMDDGTGSLDLRHRGGDRWRVRLRRPWERVEAISARRRRAAAAVLQTLLLRAPAGERGEVLAAFGMRELVDAVKQALAGVSDDRAEAAADRALLHLHEMHVVTLQRGLAIFRQAMGIGSAASARAIPYTKDEFRDLAEHYDERVVQVHVMGEYARLGAADPARAAALRADYFGVGREEFLGRWFADRREELARATSGESWRQIVEELGSGRQRRIVTASAERDLLVLAGPGSGKTRVVVHRCAYLLLVERVPAESILVLCFNRGAAHELRTRLLALAGDAARGVLVHTYHALALRLVGRTASLSSRESPRAAAAGPGGGAEARCGDPTIDAHGSLDSILEEANALLRGERAVAGVEPEALRDRLLAGYRHVLVDEYQDVDREQYDLISALVGRRGSCGERAERARVLAVGDDDQMIYRWRGADATWLRRFRDDYEADVVHLVDNHRSTPHIVSAANALIAPLPGRMKAEHPVRAAKDRKAEGPGGTLADVDRVAKGRVQVHEATDRAGQVAAVFAEIDRLRSLPGGPDWGDVAVLARTHAELDPFRAWCERSRIPARRVLRSDASIPLRHVREIARAFDRLADGPRDLTPAELADRVGPLPATPSANPWVALLQRVVGEWREETGGERAPAAGFADFLEEALADQRRGHVVGEGLFLGTAHAAKGLEFPHVFVLDGGWCVRRAEETRAPEELLAEERRLLYVAMTRARRTLHLVRRADVANPLLDELARGAERWLVVRPPVAGDGVPSEVLRTRHVLLTLKEIDLGYAGRAAEDAELHAWLRALGTGASLTLRPYEDGGQQRIGLFDALEHRVGRLSNAAVPRWATQVGAVREARVLAMVRRDRSLADEAFRDSVRCDTWEVPVVEIVLG